MSDAMERRDELLRRLLLEESDPIAAFDASELAGDAAARQELVELLEAERRLDALGADEREALRPSAPGSAAHAAEERVLARVREELGADRPRPRGLNPRWFALLAAGLALALGLRWFVGSGEVEPDPGTSMGGSGAIAVEEPVADDYAEIRWSGDVPSGGYFVVQVLEAATRGEVVTSGPIEENRWTPAEAERAQWPDEILIHVEAYGPGMQGLQGRSLEVRAQRSR